MRRQIGKWDAIEPRSLSKWFSSSFHNLSNGIFYVSVSKIDSIRVCGRFTFETLRLHKYGNDYFCMKTSLLSIHTENRNKNTPDASSDDLVCKQTALQYKYYSFNQVHVNATRKKRTTWMEHCLVFSNYNNFS